jgi:hypothetical protein
MGKFASKIVKRTPNEADQACELMDPETKRLRAATVFEIQRRLHAADEKQTGNKLEADTLRFIKKTWNARNLFYVPPREAAEIIKRPEDFLRAIERAH